MRFFATFVFVLVLWSPSSAQCTDFPIVVDSELEVQFTPEQSGDRVFVWCDPMHFDGSDDRCWRFFHVFQNGQHVVTYDWHLMHQTGEQQNDAARPDNPYGTADSFRAVFYPEEDGLSSIQVRYGSSPFPDSAIWNPGPEVSLFVVLAEFEVDFPDALIPADGSPVLIPVTLTPDDDVFLAGWNFAFLFDSDRLNVAAHTSSTWATSDVANPDGLPLGISSPVVPGDFVGAPAPNFWAPYIVSNPITVAGQDYQPGFGWVACVIDLLLVDSPFVASGQPFEAFFLEVSAKPGAAEGPVEFQVVSWDDTFPVPSYVNTKISSIAYTFDVFNGAAQEFPRSTGWSMVWGPFENMAPAFEQPSWVIAEANPFQPGDLDASGTATITDAIGMLQFLFQGQAVPCARAVDANLDHALTLTDPVFVLSYSFASGPAPFGRCMVTTTDDCSVGMCP